MSVALPGQQKTVRIVAAIVGDKSAHPTVNVSTVPSADMHAPYEQRIQATAAQATADGAHAIPVVQAGATGAAAGSQKNGLTTVYVPAYTGPA